MIENNGQIDRGYIRFVESVFGKRYDENMQVITEDRFKFLLERPDLISLLKPAVDQAMSSLLGYEQRALQVYFGFGQENPDEHLRLKDVGERIYDEHIVKRSRARQIIARALRKMRHPSRLGLITAVLDDERLNEG